MMTSPSVLDARAGQTRIAHKSKWSALEDEQLRTAISEYGTCSWNVISHCVPTRTGKQCRERWLGQLAPTVSKDVWLPEEDNLLRRSHATTGNRWTILAEELPGRSPLSIKNRWNWLMRHGAAHRPGIDHFAPNVAFPRRLTSPDVLESKTRSGHVLAPLGLEAGLFGAPFQEFQAKMFS
jgi:hypothetical protein